MQCLTQRGTKLKYFLPVWSNATVAVCSNNALMLFLPIKARLGVCVCSRDCVCLGTIFCLSCWMEARVTHHPFMRVVSPLYPKLENRHASRPITLENTQTKHFNCRIKCHIIKWFVFKIKAWGQHIIAGVTCTILHLSSAFSSSQDHLSLVYCSWRSLLFSSSLFTSNCTSSKTVFMSRRILLFSPPCVETHWAAVKTNKKGHIWLLQCLLIRSY